MPLGAIQMPNGTDGPLLLWEMPMSSVVQQVVDVLGGTDVVERVNNDRELMHRIRAGLPFDSFESAQARLGHASSRLANIVGITKRTLARRRHEGRLQRDESDNLVRFARIFAHALSVFGDDERAAAWLTRPNRALGGDTPLDWLDTDWGTLEVDQVLGRLEHGVFG